METFITSSVPPLSPYTFSLASSADGFDTCGKKGGDEEEKGMILGAVTGVFNLTSYSGPPTDSTIISPDKAVVFPSIYDTTTLLAYSVLSPSSDTIYPVSSPSSPPSDNILLASSPPSFSSEGYLMDFTILLAFI